MQIVPMAMDGACLFTAVAFAIIQRFSLPISTTSSTVCQQYVNLGIRPTSTLEGISQTLRSLMTTKLTNNRTRYLPFLQNINDREYMMTL